MSNPFNKLPFGTQRFSGYTSDPSNASPDYISRPSQNCLVTEDGKVVQRFGYQEEFSIGVDGSPATCFYHKTYDCTFFALGTKVYYRDFTNQITVDTGITLTAGTTRFAEFLGDLYLSNTTDGIVRIMVARVNDAAANAGDSAITIDSDGAARLSVFGDTTGSIRINGTNEAFNAVAISTGVLTLTGTLSQMYSDNAVCIFVDNSYSGLEEPSKILFWKSRLHIMGFPSAVNADAPNNSVMCGQFVAGQTGASGIELIIDFTYGTGGSTKIVVGMGGKLTNILGVKDYIYFFMEDSVHATAASDIADSGSSIGLTIPILKDELHGCLNEDSATVMGDNALTYITSDKRFMSIPIDTQTGAAVSHPQEDYDVDIRDELKNMDRDQTGAFVYHYRGGRQTIYQVKISGQWYWYIRDHNVQRQVGTNIVRGCWQPPQLIGPFTGLFERNGVLYGTDASDDTVYSIFTTFTDNLTPIYCVMATGEFNVGNAMLGRAELQGEINQPSLINIRCYVWNNTSGKRSGSPKVIDGSTYGYDADNSVGAIPVGEGGAEGESTLVANWQKGFGVFPCQANKAQLVLENEQDGGYFSWSSFQLSGEQFPSPFSKGL